MSSPFIGEIRMFAGNFAPVGWAFCNGALLQISDNDALFNLIGTTYGGDGQTTFALPDLQSRIPFHVGPGFALGEGGGAETVTLTVNQIPGHGHVPQAQLVGDSSRSNVPSSGHALAGNTANAYSSAVPGAVMDASSLASAGGSQPHDNMPPYLVINFIISLFGIFPSQT